MPLPPLLNYSSVIYSIGEYSVRVQWQTPSDDLVTADNYTLTLYRDEIIFEMLLVKSSTEKHGLFLSYSVNYSVGVHGSNCIGTGNSSSFNIFKGEDHVTSNMWYLITISGRILLR